LPPLWTLDVGRPFGPIDGVYLCAVLAQAATQMGANKSIGAGDENLLSPERAFHRVLLVVELVSQF